MAPTAEFDRKFGEIVARLSVLREEMQAPAALLRDAVARGLPPDDEGVVAEDQRQQARAIEQEAAEAAIADLVAGFGEDVAAGRRIFDMRAEPTRLDKLVAFFSKPAVRRRQQARFRRRLKPGTVSELLVQADRLAGLLKDERTFVRAQRSEDESLLVTFCNERPAVLERLREAEPTADRFEAVSRNERFIQVMQNHVLQVNTRISRYNVLLHKLLADVEDLLMLHGASSGIGVSRPQVLMIEDYPNLHPAMERFAKGVFSHHASSRRREKVARAFADLFHGVEDVTAAAPES